VISKIRFFGNVDKEIKRNGDLNFDASRVEYPACFYVISDSDSVASVESSNLFGFSLSAFLRLLN
jgi:hypothetical protein